MELVSEIPKSAPHRRATAHLYTTHSCGMCGLVDSVLYLSVQKETVGSFNFPHRFACLQ